MQRTENNIAARKQRSRVLKDIEEVKFVARCSAWAACVIWCGSALPQRCEQRSRRKWHICMRKLRRPDAPQRERRFVTACQQRSLAHVATWPRRHRHSTPKRTTTANPPSNISSKKPRRALVRTGSHTAGGREAQALLHQHMHACRMSHAAVSATAFDPSVTAALEPPVTCPQAAPRVILYTSGWQAALKGLDRAPRPAPTWAKRNTRAHTPRRVTKRPHAVKFYRHLIAAHVRLGQGAPRHSSPRCS